MSDTPGNICTGDTVRDVTRPEFVTSLRGCSKHNNSTKRRKLSGNLHLLYKATTCATRCLCFRRFPIFTKDSS